MPVRRLKNYLEAVCFWMYNYEEKTGAGRKRNRYCVSSIHLIEYGIIRSHVELAIKAPKLFI